MARSELEFFDPEVSDLRWQSVEGFGGQVYEKILAKDPDTGDETVMVKLAPGVETKELSIHDFWEEAYIIDGVIKDLSIKKVFTQGMYACRPPGMKHGPYEFPYGLTALEFHYSDHRFSKGGKPEREFFDPEVSDLRWQSVEGFGGQVYEKVLARDPDTGDETVMVKLGPGVETKEPSIHDFWEEAYIIDGVIKDLSIKKVFTQGMYACRPPGMKHGPYEFPYGVTVLEFHYQR